MDLVGPVRDRVRTLFRIRVSRGLVSAGAKPPLGARIHRDDLRMAVQAGMSDALWGWLLKTGWREITYRPDRRQYRDLPTAYVTRLIDSTADDRERVMAAAIANASYRPRPGRRGAWTLPNGRP